MKLKTLIFLLISQLVFANQVHLQNFLYIGGNSDNLKRYEPILIKNKLDGVQIVYTWKSLEHSQGQYNFTQIENNLKYLQSINKKLVVQLQDRFFEPQAKYVPNYLLLESRYGGGLVMQLDNPGENKPQVAGWVTIQWNDNVRARFQSLIKALAKRFDGQIYMINLPETAIDINTKQNKTGFTCNRYFDAELDNIKATREYFKQSYVVQFVNFFPCEWDNDHQYMSRLFDFAINNKIGLGGPDVVPYKKTQMHNSYPFFYKHKGKLDMVAMAVQEPTLTYINPKTKKRYSKKELTAFATNYLGANIIFWIPEVFK